MAGARTGLIRHASTQTYGTGSAKACGSKHSNPQGRHQGLQQL
jgi:hypothetical protein